jgi:hypothetical protein
VDDSEQDARSTLLGLARSIAEAASSEVTGGLNRLIIAESKQFPELARHAVELQGIAVSGIRQTLERLHARGLLSGLKDPQRSAQIFLEMIASVQRRNSMLGLSTPKKESDHLTEMAVDLFLHGCAHAR